MPENSNRRGSRFLAFFHGDPDAGNAADGDPLMDIVWQYPGEAIWFMKAVMFFGGIWGVAVSVPCVVFLSMHWEQCAPCNRPLRHWVLIHCILQLLQAPVRFIFFQQLRIAETQNADMHHCVRRMTRSPAWRTSKAISVATYGWFVLGVVWILNSLDCAPCPGLYRLTLAVITTSVARLILTLFCFYQSFPSPVQVPAPAKPQGALQKDIDVLGSIVFVPEPHEHGDAPSCAVCLSEFARGNMLRALPCGHRFHQRCIDKWLRRNKVCPLCLRDIDAPSDNDKKPKTE